MVNAVKGTYERLRETACLVGQDRVFRLCGQGGLLGRMNCSSLEQGAFWKKEEADARKAQVQKETKQNKTTVNDATQWPPFCR